MASSTLRWRLERASWRSHCRSSRRYISMNKTRRGFLVSAGLATGAATLPAAKTASGEGEDYYDKLGVTKIINAAGTYTMFTASIMPPVVQAAVAKAAKHPVRLAELQKKAGEYLAKKLQCEGALVSEIL